MNKNGNLDKIEGIIGDRLSKIRKFLFRLKLVKTRKNIFFLHLLTYFRRKLWNDGNREILLFSMLKEQIFGLWYFGNRLAAYRANVHRTKPNIKEDLVKFAPDHSDPVRRNRKITIFERFSLKSWFCDNFLSGWRSWPNLSFQLGREFKFSVTQKTPHPYTHTQTHLRTHIHKITHVLTEWDLDSGRWHKWRQWWF